MLVVSWRNNPDHNWLNCGYVYMDGIKLCTIYVWRRTSDFQCYLSLIMYWLVIILVFLLFKFYVAHDPGLSGLLLISLSDNVNFRQVVMSHGNTFLKEIGNSWSWWLRYSMIQENLQFVLRIALRCVIHRCANQGVRQSFDIYICWVSNYHCSCKQVL